LRNIARFKIRVTRLVTGITDSAINFKAAVYLGFSSTRILPEWHPPPSYIKPGIVCVPFPVYRNCYSAVENVYNIRNPIEASQFVLSASALRVVEGEGFLRV
jgi:hypothetical protein